MTRASATYDDENGQTTRANRVLFHELCRARRGQRWTLGGVSGNASGTAAEAELTKRVASNSPTWPPAFPRDHHGSILSSRGKHRVTITDRSKIRHERVADPIADGSSKVQGHAISLSRALLLSRHDLARNKIGRTLRAKLQDRNLQEIRSTVSRIATADGADESDAFYFRRGTVLP